MAYSPASDRDATGASGSADTDFAWWQPAPQRPTAAPSRLLLQSAPAGGARLRRILGAETGFEIQTVGSTELALAALKLGDFDVVVLDGGLGDLADAVAGLRSDPRASALPIIVLGAGPPVPGAVRVALDRMAAAAIGDAVRAGREAQGEAPGAPLPSEGPRTRSDARVAELATLFSLADAAILGVDARGTCIYASPAAAELLALQDASELVSRSLRELIPPNVLAAGRGEVLRFDGTVATVLVSERAAERGAGRLQRVVTLRDMSAERAREDRFFQCQKLIALGELVGGISHDFSNLLTIVSGNLSEITLVPDLSDEVREMCEDALSASLDGVSLTRRLVALVRERQIRPRAVDLGLTLSDFGRVLQRLLKRQVQLEWDCEEGVCAVLDRAQLESAVLNLMLNAQHALPSGGGRIALGVDVCHEERHGELVELARVFVRDDGAGMDEETRRRATEPFFTTRREAGGTGLGLAMVQRFVQQFHGSLTIESAPGAGTRIALAFPRVAHASPRTAIYEREQPRAREESRCVMVVDADVRIRRYAGRLLGNAGHRVLEACDADGAKDLLANEREAALVMLDARVAETRSGRDLLAWMRRERPGLRVVITTAQDAPADASIAASGVHHLRKPYSESELNGLLIQILGR